MVRARDFIPALEGKRIDPALWATHCWPDVATVKVKSGLFDVLKKNPGITFDLCHQISPLGTASGLIVVGATNKSDNMRRFAAHLEVQSQFGEQILSDEVRTFELAAIFLREGKLLTTHDVAHAVQHPGRIGNLCDLLWMVFNAPGVRFEITFAPEAKQLIWEVQRQTLSHIFKVVHVEDAYMLEMIRLPPVSELIFHQFVNMLSKLYIEEAKVSKEEKDLQTRAE